MAGRSSSGMLSTFGSESTYVSASSSRIKVWDVQSGDLQQQLVDPANLGTEYTCMAAAFSGGAKAASGLPGAGSGGYIALGTQQGAVAVWNVATGESFQLASQAEAMPIRDVCFNKQGSQLFSCTADGVVCQWNLFSQTLMHAWKPEPASGDRVFGKLCLSPDETLLLIASSHLLVWDIANQRVHMEFSGHKSPVVAVAVSPDGKFAATSSFERSVHIWSLQQAAGGRKKHRQVIVAHSTLVAAQDPVALRFNNHNQQFSSYHIAAVLRDSVALWDWAPPSGESAGVQAGAAAQVGTPAAASKKNSRKRKAPESSPEEAGVARIVSQSTVSLPPLEEDNPAAARALAKDWRKRQANNSLAPAEFLRVHGARFVSASALLVVRQFASPHFHRVEFKPPASVDILGNLVPSITLPPVSDGLLQGGAKKAQGQGRAPVDVLSAFSGSASGGASSVSSALPDQAEQSQPARELASMTLAERLAVFNQQQEALEAKKSSSSSEAAADGSSTAFVAPSAGSLHNVLAQAIKTNDNMLIEECLSLAHGQRNAQVIARTVQRLSPKHALELVRIVIRRFKRNPARGPQLLPWFKQIFTLHTSYLLSMPWLREELLELNSLVDMRLNSFQKMLRLKGRLDLVLGQAEGVESAADGEVHDNVPRSVYVESEDTIGGDDDDLDDIDMDDEDDHDDFE